MSHLNRIYTIFLYIFENEQKSIPVFVTELCVNIINMCACLFQDEMDWMNFLSHTKKKSVDFGFCCILSRE